MQLFALSETQELIPASQAERQQDYACPECRSRVRIRAGQFRTAHFYHLDETRCCRQNGKSGQHLQAQFSLQHMLPEAKLEVSFPSISRIADVAWEREKIVFEIQCSPISSQELAARNRDYQSLGWKTIWIFHEDRYNKQRLTAAEWIIRREAHYFTDIDEDGNGNFFTHLCEISHGVRSSTLLRKPISFTAPTLTLNKIHFIDDGWETILSQKIEPFSIKTFFILFFSRLRIVSKAIFYHFFEKVCRSS